VDVRGVVSTSIKVADSDRNIVPDGRRHGQDIGRGAESACADRFSRFCVHKIELEIPVRKEADPFNGCWGFHEFCDELGTVILSGDGGESERGKDKES
jgi:spore coat polysaccharide biosynthesis protein SpsF (cytidylyltransferase family)